jgi:hypothetical protein
MVVGGGGEGRGAEGERETLAEGFTDWALWLIQMPLISM